MSMTRLPMYVTLSLALSLSLIACDKNKGETANAGDTVADPKDSKDESAAKKLPVPDTTSRTPVSAPDDEEGCGCLPTACGCGALACIGPMVAGGCGCALCAEACSPLSDFLRGRPPDASPDPDAPADPYPPPPPPGEDPPEHYDVRADVPF